MLKIFKKNINKLGINAIIKLVILKYRKNKLINIVLKLFLN